MATNNNNKLLYLPLGLGHLLMDRKIPGVDYVNYYEESPSMDTDWSIFEGRLYGDVELTGVGVGANAYEPQIIPHTAFCNCTSTLDVASINFVEYDLDITTMNEVDESSSDRSQWKAPPVRVEPMNE